MHVHTKTGLITDVSGVKHFGRRSAGGSGRQAAIRNQMIDAHGVAYIAAANTILQASYLWPHKGNCQCTILYLSMLARVFSCHRERSHEGRREEDALKNYSQSRLNIWHVEVESREVYLLNFYSAESQREMVHFLIQHIYLMTLQMSIVTCIHLIKIDIFNFRS